MTDEQDFNAIRDALLADDPGTVPVKLRARMAAIPVHATRERAVTGWRQRLVTFAVPVAVLAGVAVIAFVFGGLTLRGQQTASAQPTVGPSVIASGPSAPTASASPAIQPSPTSSASPSATVLPSPLASQGPITLDPSRLTGLMAGTFGIRDNIGYVRSMADTVSRPTLLAIDLGNSQNSGTLVALKNGHDIASYALTDAGVVWIETWYTQKPIDCAGMVPCSPHEYQPVSWALNLTTLDKTTTRLDTGVVSRTSLGGQVASPLPPEMAAQGDRVAYAVPRLHVAGAPNASAIIIRSLPGGNVVRRIDTKGYVAQLGLFGQAVMYRAMDTADAGGFAVTESATLYATATDAEAPRTYGSHVSWATIGDGGGGGDPRIAWTSYGEGDGKVRVAGLGLGAPTVVEPDPRSAGGGWNVVLVGDGVAWIVQVQDATGASSSVVDVWHPGWASGRVVPSLGSPDAMGASQDKLLVSGGGVADLTGAPEIAVPASALFGTP